MGHAADEQHHEPLSEHHLRPASAGTDDENRNSENGTRTRRASPLPKAPQGSDVAKRLLHHAALRKNPVQRFDSADYFLEQHKEQQRRSSESSAMSDAMEQQLEPPQQLEQPQLPPPLSRD